MRLFDAYLIIDWSARQRPSPRAPTADALWVGEGIADKAGEHVVRETYWRTRHTCIMFLHERLQHHLALGRRVFVGYDFAFGYPAGTVAALGLHDTLPPWRRLWNELRDLIQDDEDNHNNRFEVANSLNGRIGSTLPGPLWGCPVGMTFPALRPTSPRYPYPVVADRVLARLRWCDASERGLQPVWKLYGPASVGGQTLLGIPAVCRLRDAPDLAAISRVWPFETNFTATPTPTHGPWVIHAEIWPTLVARQYPALPIKDQAQVRALVTWLLAQDDAGVLSRCFAAPPRVAADALQACATEEGWIVGAGLT